MLGCSCAAQDGPIFDGDEAVVLVGRVGADDGRGVFDFAVERWFRGGSDAVVRLQSATTKFADGTVTLNTCGLNFESGQHLILVASGHQGVLAGSICSPSADVDSRQGQAMFAAAVTAFGPGIVPGEPPPEVSDDAPTIDLVTIAIVAVVGLLVLVVVGVVVSAVGRREPPAAKP